jgi:xanthine dehydrogenase accessory factor
MTSFEKSIGLPNSATVFKINPSDFSNNVLATACKWSKFGPVALATLVGIEGNAPYPVGAQMLIGGEEKFRGQFEGQITGGCAERAIADHAVQAIRGSSNAIHRYGLNSPYFDIQLPCGSGIDVYFDVGRGQDEFKRMQLSLSCRQTVDYKIALDGKDFVKIFTPQPMLILAGQGPILAELARWARMGGFDTLVLVQNEETQALCNHYQLHSTLMSSFDLSQLPEDPFTGIVSLFHEHEFEVPLFKHTLSGDYFYFGALGSRRTHGARLASLSSADVSGALLSKINGPVGVDIRANTPSQIAVAIMAQAIDQLNTMLAERYSGDTIKQQLNTSGTPA